MKKKLVSLLLAATLVSSMGGCGENVVGNPDSEPSASMESTVSEQGNLSGGESQTGTVIEGEKPGQNNAGSGYTIALKDMDVDSLVTLGDYKNIKITLEEIEIDPEEVEATLLQAYQDACTAQLGGVLDRAVAEGDTVIIDYKGMKDGVAFAGGTAQGADLEIGSHHFIEGFEEGLIGVMPGETVNLDLTFPEAYYNADLAGQAVVFEVTVQFILPTECTEDAVVASMEIDGIETVDQLRAYAEEYLISVAQQERSSEVESQILEAVVGACTFAEFPEELVGKYETNIRSSVENQCLGYGISPDEYCMYVYNSDFDTFANTFAQEAVKQSLVFQAIANRENLNISDDELNAELQMQALYSGYSSVEEFMGTNTLEDFREYYMFNNVMAFLQQNVADNDQ